MQVTPSYHPSTAILTTSANVAAGTVTPVYDTCRSAATPIQINGTVMPSQDLQGALRGTLRAERMLSSVGWAMHGQR